MNYRAEFEDPALTQLTGLPQAAFDALVERVADLVREPWDADLMTPGGDPAYRQAIFGHGVRNMVLICSLPTSIPDAEG